MQAKIAENLPRPLPPVDADCDEADPLDVIPLTRSTRDAPEDPAIARGSLL